MSMRLTADVAALVRLCADLDARLKRLEARPATPFAPTPWTDSTLLVPDVPELPKPELYEAQHRGFGRWWVTRNGRRVEGPLVKEAADARVEELRRAVEANRAA